MKLQNKKGFTLIELLVVITIIGILATWATATYTSQIQKARDTTRVNDVKALQAGIEQSYQDAWAYPTEDITWFWTGWVGKYVERLPIDPKSTQVCNKWTSATGTPCDFLYNVWNDANWVTLQVYNLSTWLENSWNITSKADNTKDNWVMENRLEIWVWLKQTSISSATTVASIANTVATCTVTDTNFMVIKWNCN